jgi:hypothetical protein
MGYLGQNNLYMPRKDKKNELKKWISELKAYMLIVVYDAYRFQAVVLADTEADAEAVAKNTYPDAKEWILSTAYNRVIA